MKRNNCLNLLKCLACFGVVFIHVTFPGTFGKAIKYMFVWAVPLFLMIAGYFSYNCDEKKLVIKLKKILKIFLFGYIIFLACHIVLALKKGNLLEWFMLNYNWKNIILFFWFCTVRWAIPLWYLIAMAEIYLFWILVIRHNKQDSILKLTWLFFIIGTLLVILVDSMKLNWSYKINFLFYALPWFLFGYLVKEKYENDISKINNLKILSLIFIGLIISISVILFNTKIDYSYIGVLLTAPALFVLGIKNSEIQVYNPILYIGDKLSLFIYIFHVPLAGIIGGGSKYLRLNNNYIYSCLYPIIVLMITVVFSYLFDKMLFHIKSYKK